VADFLHVTVRSRLLPVIDFGYDPTQPDGAPAEDASAAEGSSGSFLLGWLRPSVTVKAPLLGEMTRAPWGDPGDGWKVSFPVAIAALAAVVGLAVYGAVCLVRRRR